MHPMPGIHEGRDTQRVRNGGIRLVTIVLKRSHVSVMEISNYSTVFQELVRGIKRIFLGLVLIRLGLTEFGII